MLQRKDVGAPDGASPEEWREPVASARPYDGAMHGPSWTTAAGPWRAAPDETDAGGRRATTGSRLRATLESVLRTPPEDLGYPTYQGRFGWSVPKLLRCLREKHGIELSRSTLRRALSELDYDWQHKRWMPHRDGRGRAPAGRPAPRSR